MTDDLTEIADLARELGRSPGSVRYLIREFCKHIQKRAGVYLLTPKEVEDVKEAARSSPPCPARGRRRK